MYQFKMHAILKPDQSAQEVVDAIAKQKTVSGEPILLEVQQVHFQASVIEGRLFEEDFLTLTEALYQLKLGGLRITLFSFVQV